MNPLNDEWILWFHNPKDENWDLESYKKVVTMKTIEDFWKVHRLLDNKKIQEGMFFLMKNDIEPIWENEKNINGGCWSFKINKKNVYSYWVDICRFILSQNITKDRSNDMINGISVSPKKSFCIVKIWNSDSTKNSKELLTDKINTDQCIYRAHNSRM